MELMEWVVELGPSPTGAGNRHCSWCPCSVRAGTVPAGRGSSRGEYLTATQRPRPPRRTPNEPHTLTRQLHAARPHSHRPAHDLVVTPRLATEHGGLALLYTTTLFGSPRDVTLDEIASRRSSRRIAVRRPSPGCCRPSRSKSPRPYRQSVPHGAGTPAGLRRASRRTGGRRVDEVGPASTRTAASWAPPRPPERCGARSSAYCLSPPGLGLLTGRRDRRPRGQADLASPAPTTGSASGRGIGCGPDPLRW